MKQRPTDDKWMLRALSLACRGIGMTCPNPPVGAVLVKRGRIVGEGYHRRAGLHHAEIVALNMAGARAKGATLYVTLEPCCTQGRTPPCTAALISSGISRVVISARDPNPAHSGRGIRILRRAGIVVTEGIRSADGRLLIKPFTKWISSGVPFVTLKLAMSADGRIADFAGRSKWISSVGSRAAVGRLREQADAILVGARTAVADDPSLLPGRNGRRHPMRIIADSTGSLPLTARVLCDGMASRTIVATTRRCDPVRARGYAAKGAQVWKFPAAAGRIRLRDLLNRLGRAGILHVVCEGGGEMAASLLKDGLVDEFLLFVAPMVLGGTAIPAFAGAGWTLKACPRLSFIECRKSGQDIVIRAVPAGALKNRKRRTCSQD